MRNRADVRYYALAVTFSRITAEKLIKYTRRYGKIKVPYEIKKTTGINAV